MISPRLPALNDLRQPGFHPVGQTSDLLGGLPAQGKKR